MVDGLLNILFFPFILILGAACAKHDGVNVEYRITGDPNKKPKLMMQCEKPNFKIPLSTKEIRDDN